MEVKIKKLHKDAVIPTYANNGDAGLDLTAVSYEFDEYGNVVYHTGLAFEIPEGYVGLVFPRSSICKQDLSLTNAVGVIDSSFRGEVTAKFKPTLCFGDGYLGEDDVKIFDKPSDDYPSSVGYMSEFNTDCNSCSMYKEGERIAQMIILPYPQIEFKEVEELSETERGSGSYGSTGK